MILTEQEANTKICPLTFAVREVRGPDGAGIREGGPGNCIGSTCMAWRWRGGGPDFVEIGEVGRGYCGLAGSASP